MKSAYPRHRSPLFVRLRGKLNINGRKSFEVRWVKRCVGVWRGRVFLYTRYPTSRFRFGYRP